MQESAQQIKKNQSNLPPFWKTNNIFPYDCIFNDVPLWFVKINGGLLTQIIALPPLRYSNSSSSHHTWLRCEWQFQQRHGIGRRKVVNPAVSGAGVVWLVFPIAFPETNSLHLKMNGWKKPCYFWDGIFSGANCYNQEVHLFVFLGCWKDAQREIFGGIFKPQYTHWNPKGCYE